MADITIGVPVYNGMPLIGESLACLARQTYRDLEILIYDNASTDGTSEVCAAFAARDSRFRHIRREDNVGVSANFRSPLEDAKTPYFSWRAYDDYSSDDFYERLHALLVANPSAVLAGSQIEVIYQDRPPKLERVSGLDMKPGLARTARLLNTSYASWIYGLWRTPALREIFADAQAHYPTIQGQDTFVLFQAIYPDLFVGTNETTFTQRRTSYTPQTRHKAASQAQRWEWMELLLRECRRWAREHVPPKHPIDALVRDIVILRYAILKNQKLHKYIFSRRNLPLPLQRAIGYRKG